MIAFLVAYALLSADIGPHAGDWIRLEVSKTGLMRGKKHVFAFPSYQGSVDAAKPSFTLSLESGKIQLLDDWLKQSDLRKVMEFTLQDMLDAKKYPSIDYRTTSVQRNGNEAVAQGVLRIRGIEKPVEVKIKEVGAGIYEGSSSVDMRLFGLKPPSAALGTIGTDPMLRLQFRLSPR